MVCERLQWSRSYFLSLPYDEIMDWLAWELQRRKAKAEAIAVIQRDKDASIVAARALLLLLQSG